MHPFLRIGHRGASGHEPENTLRSIRRALALGANGIEIDVRLTRDGELAVFHDARLSRVTDGGGLLARRTLAELRQLDAGKGEKIPTLREVLDLLAGRAWLNIELKAPGTGAAVLREAERAIREGGWNPRDLVVSSFDRGELAAMLRCAGTSETAGLAKTGRSPGVPRVPFGIGVLVSRRPASLARLAAPLGATSLHLPRRLAIPTLITRAHSLGLRVYVFTVNDGAEIARLKSMGVDGVFTDFPERALSPEEKSLLPDETEAPGIEAAL